MVFAIVRYGSDRQILVNPQCTVINLLDHLRRRCYQRTAIILDLTDETGLVVDLDAHKTEYAEKYLKTHETYILVEKQTPEEDLLIPEFGSLTGDLARTPSPAPSVRSARSQTSDKVKYVALLENVQELLPEYRLRRANEKKKETGSRPMSRTSEEDSPGNTASARAKSRGHKSIKTVAHAVSAKRRMRGSGQT